MHIDRLLLTLVITLLQQQVFLHILQLRNNLIHLTLFLKIFLLFLLLFPLQPLQRVLFELELVDLIHQLPENHIQISFLSEE